MGTWHALLERKRRAHSPKIENFILLLRSTCEEWRMEKHFLCEGFTAKSNHQVIEVEKVPLLKLNGFLFYFINIYSK
jgi:hypothetical protein